MRVVIVDDDAEIRECYRLIIDASGKFVVVGDYPNCENAIAKIIEVQPDIVLMDISLPGITGIEGTRIIKEKFQYAEVVISSVFEDDDQVFEALKAGASGYISKFSSYTKLISGLEEIVTGGAAMSCKVARMVVQHFHTNLLDNPLDHLETEILHSVAEGRTYSQISELLFISKDTIPTHIRNIYRKLQINKTDSIKIANKHRFIGNRPQ